MKFKPVALAGALALLGGVAIAQTSASPPEPSPPPQPPAPVAPAPPPPTPGPRMGGDHPRPERMGPGMQAGPGRPGPDGGWGGPVGEGRGGWGGPGHGRPPMMSKGTMLRVERDGGFTLKCADEDSTRSCMEAAAPVVEKLLQLRQAGR